MRAGRLINLVVLLQRRGRTTAAELATELEVSVRTVLRDVEALSSAGVPIYATQGAGGGIELLDGFQSRLTGFTADEASAVLLAGQPRVAESLGLAAPAAAARRKLLLGLTPELAGRASSLDDWFLHDPADPDGCPPELIRRIRQAIEASVEITFTDPILDDARPGPTAPNQAPEPSEATEPTGATGPTGPTRARPSASNQLSGDREAAGPEVLRPLGLVLAGSAWRLVHLTPAGPAVRPLGHHESCTLGRRFTRPPNFHLPTFWRTHRLRHQDPGRRASSR